MESHRYADLIYSTDDNPSESSISNDTGMNQDFIYRGKKLPIVTGVGSLEETVSVLDMLSRYYNVPFRRDIVQRAARDALRSSNPSLEIIGGLSTLMSLSAQSRTFRPLNYLVYPFLVLP